MAWSDGSDGSSGAAEVRRSDVDRRVEWRRDAGSDSGCSGCGDGDVRDAILLSVSWRERGAFGGCGRGRDAGLSQGTGREVCFFGGGGGAYGRRAFV